MSKPANRNRILVFICTVMFLDAVGFGLILPVMPDLLDEIAGLSIDEGAFIAGALLTTFAAMQFIFAPILGALSDRFGRRPILLIALAGFAVDYFIMAWAPTLAWLFFARALSGLCGATFAAANASVVDISDPAERAKFFGFTSAAVGLGFVFGPSLGGLLGDIHVRAPFIAAGGLVSLVLVIGLFIYPETLSDEKRRDFTWTRANPVGNLLAIARHPAVLILLGVLFTIQLANHSYSSIWPFYTKEVAGWSALMIGVSVSVYGILMVAVQAGLVGPVVKAVGEAKTVWFSLAVGVASFLILAVAGTGWQIYAGIFVGALSGFVGPALQALMTKGADEDAQGELQGAITSLYGLSAIISPFVMAIVFSRFTDGDGVYLPGAPFVAAILLLVIGGVLFSRVPAKQTPLAVQPPSSR